MVSGRSAALEPAGNPANLTGSNRKGEKFAILRFSKISFEERI
ncbi:MAG: hypothetical protein ACJAU6_000854 [Alphaproteobacteria bacterium]|jgi:hypothetical protein